MKNDLFDETFVLIDCVLKNKILIIAMIDIDVIEYAFVDESIAQSLCDTLKIESVQLMKKRLVKVYDERKNQIITHAIYSKMIIQRHIESLIFMLIIKLEQQALILDKSWMRKHKISYHEKTNIIEFFTEFCTHSKEIKTKMTFSSNKKKTFLSKRNLFQVNWITRNSITRSKTRENRKESSLKFFLEKKFVLINQLINQRIDFFKKTKNRQISSIRSIFSMRLKISNSILMSSKSLIRKRRNFCLRWALRWLRHSFSTWWINVRTWICFSSFWRT
jgi:hypothetical protein